MRVTTAVFVLSATLVIPHLMLPGCTTTDDRACFGEAPDGGAFLLVADAQHVTTPGAFNLRTAAPESVRVVEYNFFRDGIRIGSSRPTFLAPDGVLVTQFSAADNGTHSFAARAEDECGNVGDSNTVEVTVDIAAPPDAGIEPDAGPSTARGRIYNRTDFEAVVSLQYTDIGSCTAVLALDAARLGTGLFFNSTGFDIPGPFPRTVPLQLKVTTIGVDHFFEWPSVGVSGDDIDISFYFDAALADHYTTLEGTRLYDGPEFTFGSPLGCTGPTSSSGPAPSSSQVSSSSRRASSSSVGSTTSSLRPASSLSTFSSSSSQATATSSSAVSSSRGSSTSLAFPGSSATQSSSAALGSSSSSTPPTPQSLRIDTPAEILCTRPLPALSETTVEFWFKNSISGGSPILFSNHIYDSNSGMMIGIDGTAMDFRVQGNDVHWTQDIAPSPDVWTHLVATYDGMEKRIYLDGQMVFIQAFTGQMTTSPRSLCFGGYADGPCTSAYRYFGLMDSVGVWSRAMDATEAAGRSLGPPQPNSPGLVLWMGFNEPSGSVMMDEVSGTGFSRDSACGGQVDWSADTPN